MAPVDTARFVTLRIRFLLPSSCNIDRTDLRMLSKCPHCRDDHSLYNDFHLGLKFRDLGASLTKWRKLLSIITLRAFALKLRGPFFKILLKICDPAMYHMWGCGHGKFYTIGLGGGKWLKSGYNLRGDINWTFPQSFTLLVDASSARVPYIPWNFASFIQRWINTDA